MSSATDNHRIEKQKSFSKLFIFFTLFQMEQIFLNLKSVLTETLISFKFEITTTILTYRHTCSSLYIKYFST